MADFIIGSNGRFAKAFKSVLSVNNEPGSISFQSLESNGFEELDSVSRDKKENIFWTIGAGSRSVADCSKELELLKLFHHYIAKTKSRFQKFVYLSTGGSMYGNGLCITEDMPLKPVGLHGKLKFECEKFIQSNLKSYFEQIYIMRVANAYSLEHFSDGRGFIDRLMISAHSATVVPIQVKPISKRQYGTHLDYAKFMSQIVFGQLFKRRGYFEINVASSHILSISEITQAFEMRFPGQVKIEWREGPEETLILSSNWVESSGFGWQSLQDSLNGFKTL